MADTDPADLAPVIQFKVVDEATLGEVQLVPPIVAVAPDTKPVPVIVTLVPPAVVPLVGAILETVGAIAAGVLNKNAKPIC